jgi:superfamily II RNA helicase
MTETPRPLSSFLPPNPGPGASQDDILNGFLAYAADRGLSLYPAQEEAVLELVAGKNVILGTPTGSGKSLVAFAMIFKGLCEGRRSVYTSPTKALANEKFFALCQDLGAERVGMLTGDAAINRDAPVLCCTAEILCNMALRQGRNLVVDQVIMDEFHYYGDRDRGAAWQVPLLLMRNSTFLLMSATMGDPEPFVACLADLNGKPTAVVKSRDRPVPLDYEYRETPLHETIEDLLKQGKQPIYVVGFTQRAAAEVAQALTSANFCTREEKQAIGEELKDVRFDTPYGKDVQKYARHGLGLHHAGLLPKYRLRVEKLAQRGLLKVICGTDTLGVGVNIPIRTVLFTKLCKFDGQKTAILSAREFHQIAGRAGRKGFDDRGSVVAQAPEHVIENIRIEAKKRADPSRKNLQKVKPPDKGYVHWDRETFNKLVNKEPEPLQSRFNVTHGMLINVFQDKEPHVRGGYGKVVDLIARCHNDDRSKRHLRRTAKLLFQSLVGAGVLVVKPVEGYAGHYVEMAPTLQREFSLNYTLSLYLVEVLSRLDRDSELYPLDVLTMVESILEDPDAVLWKQLDKLKREKMAQMKADGIEFDQRIEELDKMEHPKPQRDFIYGTFNEFASHHPWLGKENIRPKSVAREMYERYSTFNDYVLEYDLQRSEGLLLRYLSDAYKALCQTVPESFRDEGVLEVMAFLRALVRNVDSSLVDEWETMHGREPGDQPAEREAPAPRPPDLAADPVAFGVRVRAEMHRLLKALSDKDYQEACLCVRQVEGDPWTPARFEAAMKEYWAAYPELVVRHEARFKKYTILTPTGPRCWDARQVMVDPEGDNQWMVDGVVDLNDVTDLDGPLVAVRRVGV